MAELVDGKVYEALLDMAEKSVETGAQVVTGGTVADIFTITGGPIEVLSLIGEFTTAVTSGGASTMQLKMDPTAGGDTVMCTAVDLQSEIVNTWAYITGAIGDAVVYAEPATALPLGCTTPLVLPPGTIDMIMSNSTPSAGAITWYLRYKPLKTGITVVGKA